MCTSAYQLYVGCMTDLADLRQLRAFVQVAESGSISAAARVLGMNQPTLSRQLQALEASAGLPLIRRDTHSMSLTEAGHLLLGDARRLLAMADRMSQKLRAERDTLRGHLRVVSVVDFGQWVVSRALAKFRSLHPQITAELHLINRPTKFLEEGFDCGFLAGEPMDRSLVMRRIATLPRILAASPSLLERHGVPKRPEDLRSLPWLGILQPHFYTREKFILMGRDAEIELAVSPTLLLDSVTALREAALCGAGFTILPSWMVGPNLADGSLVHLIPDWRLPDFDLHIGYSVDRHSTARLRAFIDFVQVEIPSLLAERSQANYRMAWNEVKE